MKILDQYLIQRLAATFLKTVLSLIMLFIIIDVMTHRRGAIMDHDVPTPIVIEYYLALIPTMLNNYQLAPLSLLIAGLLVFGTFVQRSEYTAALAGGIGLKRIIVAPALVAILTTMSMFTINEIVNPHAAKRTAAIEKEYFYDDDEDQTPSGVFWPQLEGGWKCDVRTFDRDTLKGENVFLYSIQNDRHEQVEAQRIYWDKTSNTWILEEGRWTIFDPKDGMTSQTKNITELEAPFQEPPEFLFTPEVNTQTQTIAQLANLIQKHKNRTSTARRMTLDLNKKIVDPLLCLLFLALALPFSIRLGRGGLSIGLSIAIFLGLGYLVLSGIVHSMGYSGQISPILAAWFPFAVYFFGCSALILRTST